MSETPLALSVESVRSEMMRGVLVPREMVNDALRVTYEKLKAKDTKFFTHKGIVRDIREVDAHSIQLQASDQILSIAGLYARERDSAPSTPSVALEVDQNTGVVRIVVGGPRALPSPPPRLELPVQQAQPTMDTVARAVPLSVDNLFRTIFDEVDE